MVAGAAELVADGLHLLEPLPGLGRQAASLLHQLGEAGLLIVHDRLLLLHRLRQLQRLLDRLLQRRNVVGDRVQTLLHGGYAVELLLHIHDLRAQRVALALQALHLVAPSELFGQLAIDIRRDDVEVVDAAFEFLDELQARADAGQLCIQFGRQLTEPRRRLGAFVDRGHLAEHRIHLGFELGRAAEQRRGAFAERFEGRAVRRQLVAQPRRLGVSLVEFRNLGAQPFEVLARLLQGLVLRLGAPAHLVHLSEPLAERFERALLASHFVGLRHQGLERLAELIGVLVHRRQLLVLLQHAVHARFGFRHAGRQHPQPLIELIEFLLVDGEAFDG